MDQSKRPAPVPVTDDWIETESEREGTRVTIKYRPLKDDEVDLSTYPGLISLHWDFDSKLLKESETKDRQPELEELLAPMEAGGYGILVVTVTGGLVEQWHWYAPSIDGWMNRLNDTLSHHSPFPLQIATDHQPDWKLYHELISSSA